MSHDLNYEEYEEYEEQADIDISNPSQNETFESILQAYMSRRTLLKGGLVSLVLAYANPLLCSSAKAASMGFVPLTHSTEDKLLVPDSYQYNVIIGWGDPVLPDAPAFDPRAQQPAKQAQQFGYNNDFVGFLPLPAGSQNSDHGLLVVNHEYTNPELMFAGMARMRVRRARWSTSSLLLMAYPCSRSSAMPKGAGVTCRAHHSIAA